MKGKNILVIGGDKRQVYLMSLLKDRGAECSHICTQKDASNLKEAVFAADIIILPLPVTKNGETVYSMKQDFSVGIMDLCSLLKVGQTVLGGMMNDELIGELNSRGVKHYDFSQDESFVLNNAYLTALGTVRVLMEKYESAIYDKSFLITGFGNVSVAVSQYLKALGAKVIIAARKDTARTKAKCLGYEAVSLADIETVIKQTDFVINTVPCQIFTKEDTEKMKPGAVYIELASKPFGAKEQWFENNSKGYSNEPSVPGRMFPFAAAKVMADAINKYV